MVGTALVSTVGLRLLMHLNRRVDGAVNAQLGIALVSLVDRLYPDAPSGRLRRHELVAKTRD